MVGQGGETVSEGDFDALVLAGQRQALGGSVDVRTLPRAAERLADDGPVPLAWRIVGTSELRSGEYDNSATRIGVHWLGLTTGMRF